MNKKTILCPQCKRPLTLIARADQPNRIVGTCTCTERFAGAPRAMIEFDAPQGQPPVFAPTQNLED